MEPLPSSGLGPREDHYYMVDGDLRKVSVTSRQAAILKTLQKGGTVYRPARKPEGEHHLVGQVKVRGTEGGLASWRVQDTVPDTLISMGLLEVTAARAPGGFRLEYHIPQGLKFIGPYRDLKTFDPAS